MQIERYGLPYILYNCEPRTIIFVYILHIIFITAKIAFYSLSLIQFSVFGF